MNRDESDDPRKKMQDARGADNGRGGGGGGLNAVFSNPADQTAVKACQSGPWMAGVAMKSLPPQNTSEEQVRVFARWKACRGLCGVSGSSRTDG